MALGIPCFTLLHSTAGFVAGHHPGGYTKSGPFARFVCRTKRPNDQTTIRPPSFLLFVGLWACGLRFSLPQPLSPHQDTQSHQLLVLAACLETGFRELELICYFETLLRSASSSQNQLPDQQSVSSMPCSCHSSFPRLFFLPSKVRTFPQFDFFFQTLLKLGLPFPGSLPDSKTLLKSRLPFFHFFHLSKPPKLPLPPSLTPTSTPTQPTPSLLSILRVPFPTFYILQNSSHPYLTRRSLVRLSFSFVFPAFESSPETLLRLRLGGRRSQIFQCQHQLPEPDPVGSRQRVSWLQHTSISAEKKWCLSLSHTRPAEVDFSLSLLSKQARITGR